MSLYALDPLLDPRWDDLVASHPRASVFHRRGWLKTLAKTYGYRPVAVTSAPAGKRLADGVAFCEIRSCITGSRLVSLPFTDHFEPLVSGQGCGMDLRDLMDALSAQGPWKYVELRPISRPWDPSSLLTANQSFWLHRLDLTPPHERLFCNLHKSCVQRRIRHAEREHLSYERGSSAGLLADFYNLLMMTRRRHRILPQPRTWFENLITEMKGAAEIRLARKEGVPVAAILTLRHRDTVVYKYGCSDERFHHVAGMPLLFWRLIEESKHEGVQMIDLGRTEMNNEGLIQFKDRLGATRTQISYVRYAQSERQRHAQLPRLTAVRSIFSLLPDMLSAGLGRLVYRHLG